MPVMMAISCLDQFPEQLTMQGPHSVPKKNQKIRWAYYRGGDIGMGGLWRVRCHDGMDLFGGHGRGRVGMSWERSVCHGVVRVCAA